MWRLPTGVSDRAGVFWVFFFPHCETLWVYLVLKRTALVLSPFYFGTSQHHIIILNTHFPSKFFFFFLVGIHLIFGQNCQSISFLIFAQVSFLKKYFCPSISFLILGQVSQFFLFSDFWSELPKYLFFPFSFFFKNLIVLG